MRRMRRLMLVISLLLLIPESGIAQTESFRLQLKLSPGEVLAYVSASRRQTKTLINNALVSGSETLSDGTFVVRTLDVDASGQMLIEIVLEDLQVTQGGRAQQEFADPWTFRVNPDGRVVQTMVGSMEPGSDFPVALPGRPVGIGESWTRQSGSVRETLTLVSVERRPGGLVGKITNRFSGRDANTSIRGSEEVEWDIDRGRPLRMILESTTDFVVTLVGQGTTVQTRTTAQGSTRRELKGSGATIVQSVPTDRQIVPGKSIGVFTLESSVSALDQQLGASTSVGDRGPYRASRIRWGDGVSAFVDPGDSTRVVGLQIEDRTYRTERGVGFGSTEGTVLLGYGMTPTKWDQAGPPAVRILIYRDLGIAFAITSTPEHARAAGSHAPLGAVDWVIIFPPGGAEKIFPLP